MSSANIIISANLSQAFWTLWSTPMVPPEPKPLTKSVPMADLSKKRKRSSRSRASISSVDSDASSTSGASVASSTSSSH
ncbi:hypothetical protein GSI_02991 [Ganoderma sinense ZZ0214-1]|uniref:Uncharacterized protein n=1 Tax=Ganoderma sinense ZZ0214-1 TaxID=1077348 RepID=A0A2G8SN66_9APHY|nr:hypothetical protein GSI_02991 [Ganoderma sinense ZZ0214-1]